MTKLSNSVITTVSHKASKETLSGLNWFKRENRTITDLGLIDGISLIYFSECWRFLGLAGTDCMEREKIVLIYSDTMYYLRSIGTNLFSQECDSVFGQSPHHERFVT